MRTTIRIDDELYREAKSRAAQTGRSVGAVIGDAVRDSLRRADEPPRELPPLVVYGGSGALPGVDLTDPRSLRATMDDDEHLDALR